MENKFYQAKESFLKFLEALAIKRDWVNDAYYVALTLVDEMAAKSWRDVSYMESMIKWLTGKESVFKLLESAKGYKPSLIHFNAADLLDTASLHFSTTLAR